MDGFNAGVAALALGRDGFQRVSAALGLQGLHGGQHVRAQIAAGDGPFGIATLSQFVDVKRLVCAVERAQSEVKNRGHGQA